MGDVVVSDFRKYRHEFGNGSSNRDYPTFFVIWRIIALVSDDYLRSCPVYLFQNPDQSGIIWSMQAVVLIGKSQYLVSSGDVLEVDLGQNVSKTLLVIDGEKVYVGSPEVAGAKVKTKVVGESKGDKIRIATFKAKTRHRRVMGFRAKYTKLLIEDIKFSQKS